MPTPSLPDRSLGLKFLLVCLLVAIMSLPAYAVYLVLGDREKRAQEVVAEVGQRFGGEQSITGPLLVAPYRVVVQPAPTWQPSEAAGPAPAPPDPIVQTGWYVVFADTGAATADVDVDVRTRGQLFKVRTYTTDLTFSANFAIPSDSSGAPIGAEIDWSRAMILVGVADPRGLQGRADVELGGRVIPFEPAPNDVQTLQTRVPPPAESAPRHEALDHGKVMQWLVAQVGEPARPGATLTARARLRTTGVQSLGLGAFANNTDIRMQGNSPGVGYFGDFAATHREGARNFEANWSIPYAARGLSATGGADLVALLANKYVRVVISQQTPYQSVARALKYPILFIGVVFLAYFVFEATSDRRVHPAQYILVGLAQVVFYLLLLSISERLGFDWAFLIAAAATVTLIAYYLGSIFKSLVRGLGGFMVFALLYGLIYALLRAEDFALLAGSIAAFAAIAVIMMATRNLDWYGLGREPKPDQPGAAPG